MKLLSRYSFFVLLVMLLFSSCISNRRVVYFQEKSNAAQYSDTFKYDRKQYKLQASDIVQADVYTADPSFSKLFSSSTTASPNISSQGAMNGGDLFYTIGYSLNDSGDIQFPLLGKVHLAGLTLEEAQKKLEKEIRVMLTDAQVVLRIGGLRFSLLGEFNRPGKFVIMQNQVNVFEALAIGGDLKEIAKRDKIVLLRQYPDGARIHYIDVLDKNIINSPYYFLQPNDILYAEPLKRRAYGIGVNGLQTFTTALTLLSTTLLLISYINR